MRGGGRERKGGVGGAEHGWEAGGWGKGEGGGQGDMDKEAGQGCKCRSNCGGGPAAGPALYARPSVGTGRPGRMYPYGLLLGSASLGDAGPLVLFSSPSNTWDCIRAEGLHGGLHGGFHGLRFRRCDHDANGEGGDCW